MIITIRGPGGTGGDAVSAIATCDEAETQIALVADMLSDGIGAQFPDRF